MEIDSTTNPTGRRKKLLERAIDSFTITEGIVFWLATLVFVAASLYLLWQLNQNFLVEVPERGGKMTEAEWTTGQNDAMRNQNQQFSNYAGAGIGAIQTGLGVLSYFDNKKMNAKNMELMDGQIANNNDIMSTRKARASDIQKYFG